MEDRKREGTSDDAELLRFATAGSVDDGKSHPDRPAAARLEVDRWPTSSTPWSAARSRGDDDVDLSLLTDGLRAEREQGITIDVAYRYFATPRRTFILADTPGHVQYTRNMVTGASTADLAIILVDARKGLVEQTRRHAFVAALLRVPHLVLCRQQDRPGRLVPGGLRPRSRDEFSAFAAKLEVHGPDRVPISALHGDNVVEPLGADALVRRPDAAGPPGERARAGDRNLSTRGSRCST